MPRNLNIISIFAYMKKSLYIFMILWLSSCLYTHAQKLTPTVIIGHKVPVCVYKGDTIPYITLKNVFVYPQLTFKNKKQQKYYNKLVRDVKKTLPLAKEINRAVIETYEYLET